MVTVAVMVAVMVVILMAMVKSANLTYISQQDNPQKNAASAAGNLQLAPLAAAAHSSTPQSSAQPAAQASSSPHHAYEYACFYAYWSYK